MEITGRRTVPQIFIGDTHVGGYDDLVALDAKAAGPAARCCGAALHNRACHVPAAVATAQRAFLPYSLTERLTPCPTKQAPRLPDPARLPEGSVAGAAQLAPPSCWSKSSPAWTSNWAWKPRPWPKACSEVAVHGHRANQDRRQAPCSWSKPSRPVFLKSATFPKSRWAP